MSPTTAQHTQKKPLPDRTTSIGKMIDAYLRSESDLDDHAIHLLFAANRWELACANHIVYIFFLSN
jgi:thymidylate kinase